MNNPENEEIKKRVEKIEQTAKRIIKKGGREDNYLKLCETLQSHEKVKDLLMEMNYTLQRDISDDEILMKLTIIEKQMKSILEKIKVKEKSQKESIER